VIGASIAALALLAAAAALVLEIGDVHAANEYSLGSIMYLVAGVVVVLIGLVAGLTHLRRR
jgi:hypothetical protein